MCLLLVDGCLLVCASCCSAFIAAGGGKEKCDFCEGAGCEQCEPEKGGGAVTLDVKIANKFYEAEGESILQQSHCFDCSLPHAVRISADLKGDKDAKKAIAAFREVLELSKGLESVSDENHTT